MTGTRPEKRSRRLAVWLVLLLLAANLPIFVLALASGLTVGEEKTEQAKATVARTAALAAAREAVALARLGGAVEAVASTLGAETAADDVCARLAVGLMPLETSIATVRVVDGGETPLCVLRATPSGQARSAAATGASAAAQAAEAERAPSTYALRLPLRGDTAVEVEIAPRSGPGRLGDLEMPPGHAVAVLDAAHHVVAAAGDLRLLGAVATLAETVQLRPARRLEVRLPDGRWMFAVSEGVGASNVTAVAMAPLADLQAGARRDVAIAVGLPLAFLTIAVAVAWYGIDRLVVRWVERLGRVAALYGAGRQSVRVGELDGAPSEIVALGQAFDEMADRVERRSNELKAALDGKTGLLRELHHRVKNNFQLVASLLSLEARDAPPPQLRSLKIQQDRVHALAIAHRLAYASGDVGGVSITQLARDVADRARQGAGLAEGRLHVVEHGAAATIDLDTAVPLALLLTEIARPHIAAAQGGGELTLAIDGGAAVTTFTFSGGPAAPESDALAIRLVEAFGRQLGAEISVAPRSGRSVVGVPRPRAESAGVEASEVKA